ncbi:MAG: hypothetical protein ABI156_15590, partial [Caldimonas sp.]
MRRTPILYALGIALCWIGSPASAMGFGKVGSPTLLGQRLDFSARVRLEGDETLENKCVSASVHAGENRLGDDQIRVSLEAGAGPAERMVRVTTLHAIDEPVVTVDVTIGCTSRISRKFVTFLDPPMLNLARADAREPHVAEPQRIESQVAPLLAIVEPPRAGDRTSTSISASASPSVSHRRSARREHSRATRIAPAARSVRLAAADQALARGDRRAVVRVHASPVERAVAGAPRLQLEAARAVARAPEIAASAALAATIQPSLAPTAAIDPGADALRSALAQERERIQVLETGLARLRADSQANRQSLAALQARLQQAEAARYANPLVYLLGGLCLLFAAIAVLALRRGARAGVSRWWDLTQMPVVDAAVAAPVAPLAAATELAHVETPEDAPWTYQAPRLAVGPASRAFGGETRASSIGGLEVTTVIDHALLARMAAGDDSANEPLAATQSRTPHELSIEELIDLEQQVEFFIVLGQDEAAIELLSGTLHGSGAASPLPYFKLLEIYRRRGEEASYARIAEAFQQRFGAFAPTWDAALGLGRSLEDYPQAIARLQQVWTTPVAAMQALDAWLFRRQPADDTFDFGACCELLFLYGIARELSEGQGEGEGQRDADIDLLLPIEHAAVDLPLPITVATPSHFAE